MVDKPNLLIAGFLKAHDRLGVGRLRLIQHELKPAPHKPAPLPSGKCAVYVFSLSRAYGLTCPAGPNRVLKVGRVGPNSNARFQSQHYNSHSAMSNLSRSLLDSAILWRYLGISKLDDSEVARWLKENTDRDHFYLESRDRDALRPLELYIRALLGPMFEG